MLGVRFLFRLAAVVVAMLEMQELILIVGILHLLLHLSKTASKRLFAYFFPRLSADIDALTLPNSAASVEI